jgi:hypothetical protein
MANVPFNNVEAHIYSLRIQETTLTWVLHRISDLISPEFDIAKAYIEFLKDITEERNNIRKEIKREEDWYYKRNDKR